MILLCYRPGRTRDFSRLPLARATPTRGKACQQKLSTAGRALQVAGKWLHKRCEKGVGLGGSSGGFVAVAT
ncbi:hypothetical protein ETAA8_35050 [Anatilimnocola aggregata]|uniref:Uncharacterized protein n=1 Tax=Anatilimnocola aggregata TaxID=2528021 RepID=A0A517YDV3_9BACT|nr:hypothetical protein ETAA8_35050 [Anatilimnocola aggregata]